MTGYPREEALPHLPRISLLQPATLPADAVGKVAHINWRRVENPEPETFALVSFPRSR